MKNIYPGKLTFRPAKIQLFSKDLFDSELCDTMIFFYSILFSN